jgi:N-acetyl-anhydromuramyl-L-alanine amidase AmpD
LVVGALSVACSGVVADERASVDEPVGAVSSAFTRASLESRAPRDLLVAIAHVEDGLEIPQLRDVEANNEVPAAGPLQLRRGKLDTLARGAALVGASELDLRRDADLALRAGAEVLAELGRQTGARPDDLASYREAIEEMSGFADEPHRKSYAHKVFATLARGGTFTARDGETVTLPRHDLPPSLTVEIDTRLHTLATSDYPAAEWIPTSCANKCTEGRAGAKVEYVIIHDTEGNWNASVATLQNDPGKSVQYIVGTDGRVAQFVSEATTAWHGGNSVYNQKSVGIEHVGYSTKPFAEAEYAASAKLVDYLTTKYAIPRDRAHIIGHDQIPNGNRIPKASAPCALSPKECAKSLEYGGASVHTDPGVWEWPTFMTRFGGTSKCNDVSDKWTCSWDAKQAFRCDGARVEVSLCDGPKACTPGAKETDAAVCDALPKAVAPPVSEPPATVAPPAADPPPPAPLADLAPVANDDGGCSAGPRSPLGANGVGAALLGLAALALTRRSRRASTRA